MYSLHFPRVQPGEVPIDDRTISLGHLHPAVLAHLRLALAALDAQKRIEASVTLWYAVEAAILAYGFEHRASMALYQFRRVVDSSAPGLPDPDALHCALTDCLQVLSTVPPRRESCRPSTSQAGPRDCGAR